jgi:universal stress protein E
MKVIRRILVAVAHPDLAPTPAVLKAAQIAVACGAELELVHCLTAPVYFDPYGVGETQTLADIQDQIHQMALGRLERMATRLRRHGISVTTAAVWDYPAYEAIIRRAAVIGADLIVAGERAGRHRALERLRLTDWELLRWSPVPVLLVKMTQLYRRPAILAAIDPSRAYAKRLQLDAQILATATTLGRSLRGQVHAVHAFDPMELVNVFGGKTSRQAMEVLERRARSAAEDRFAKALAGTSIAQSRRQLLARHPIDAIPAAALSSRSSIVVMGALARSGLKRLAFGNTAERVLDELPCDVLILKPVGIVRHVSLKARGMRIMPLANGGRYT